MNKENDFIADDVPTKIAYRELTLNLKFQGYEFASRVSEFLEKITKLLLKFNVISENET